MRASTSPFCEQCANWRHPVEAALVWRPLQLPIPGRHYGVLLTYDDGSRIFFDLTSDRQWGWGDYAAFSRGHACRVSRATRDPREIEAILGRLIRLHEHPFNGLYDLTRCNCEHRANWVMTGRHTSGQVEAVVGGGIVFLSLCLLLATAGSGTLAAAR